MAGIEDVNRELDQVCERVDNYGENMISLSGQSPYDSLVSRAHQASRLAAELATLVDGIATDANELVMAYIPYLIAGDEFRALHDTIQGATANTTDGLGRTMPMFTVSVVTPLGNAHSDIRRLFRDVPTYAQSMSDAASGLRGVVDGLPAIQNRLAEDVQSGVAKVKDHIQDNKV